MSKRKSPALVAFSNGDRLVGEAAAGIAARYPERVYARLRDMVGKPFQAVKQLLDSDYLPYDIAEDERGAAGVRIDDGKTVFSSEELLAMLLGYARNLAEAHAKTVVKDAVITVPPYLGQTERECILVAAELGGLNVLALINEHSGAALQYGIDKDFSNESKHVVFYDMGANSAYAALIHFSAYTTKEFGKTVNSNQFQVKDVRWDASLGGHMMELRLVEYFADLFNKQLGDGTDIRRFPKAMAKLKKQVKRTKEILSANTEAILSVEAIHDDRDFRSVITRKKYEELCEDLWEQALVPIKQVLEHSGLAVEQLHAVELIGGATRVPKLQMVISDFLGKKALDRHLDADEAISLGAALHAANLSDGIKMNRKLGMVDGVSYSIFMNIESLAVASKFQGETKYELLVPRLKKLPSKVFKSLGNTEDFKLSLLYDSTDILPPGISSFEIATFEISGVTEAYSKYMSWNLSAPIKTNVHFSLSRSGFLSLDRAETVVEVSEWVEIPVKRPMNDTKSINNQMNKTSETPEGQEAQEEEGLNDITKSREEDSVAENSNTTEANNALKEPAPEFEIVMEKKLRKRTIRVPLKVKDVSVGVVRPLTKDARVEASVRLENINRRDEEKRRTAEAKNNLESYIYMAKEKIDFADGVDKVTTEEQRDSFRQELTAAEDWLYTDGEEATAAEFRERLEALKNIGEPIFFRLTELQSRPAAVELALKYLDTINDTLEEWEKKKPWISDISKNELLDAVDAFKKWLTEKQLEQQKTPAHGKAAFTSDEIYAKIVKLQDKVSTLNKIPKPKPQVGKKSSNKTSDTSSASSQSEAFESANTTNDEGGSRESDIKTSTEEVIEPQHDEL